MERLEDRVAVVTGAASGIGLGLATRFAEEGMKVVLADIEEPALDVAVATLRQQERDVIGVRADVSSYKSVEALAERAFEAYGRVNVLCNNAGVGGGTLLWLTTQKDWQWELGVNLWGVVNGIQAFVPRMLASGEEGHIVNTASIAGLASPTMDSIYSATKHAVTALSEALYFQLHVVQSRLSASVLCPGFVRTNILDADRNRPVALQNEGPSSTVANAEAARAFMQRLVDGGLPPSEVAGMVVDAIREDRFWIITTNDVDTAIRARSDSMLERRNPQLAPPA